MSNRDKALVCKQEGNDAYKKKDFAKAIELYKAAIELNPKEIMYYSNLAAVYIEQKNYDLAMAEFAGSRPITRDASKNNQNYGAQQVTAIRNKFE